MRGPRNGPRTPQAADNRPHRARGLTREASLSYAGAQKWPPHFPRPLTLRVAAPGFRASYDFPALENSQTCNNTNPAMDTSDSMKYVKQIVSWRVRRVAVRMRRQSDSRTKRTESWLSVGTPTISTRKIGRASCRERV